MIDINVGDVIEDKTHKEFRIVSLQMNGDVKARDSHNRIWYIDRMELNREYKKVSR